MFVARWVFQLYVAEKQAYESTVRALVRAVETKDLYTRQHGERVSKAAVMIARRGGMRQDRLEMLRYAGFLHDVGKLGVPTRVLQKNGRLSDAEFDAVALHPLHGFEIVSGIEFLGEAHEGIRHHHERLDGRGYPSGLKGEEIPEFARILAVADAFDAMTSTRSYRGARPVAEALLELERCKGTQFQPEFVDLLSAAVGEEGWELADSLPPLHVVDTPVIPAQGGARCHDEPAASHDGSAA
ncbi:MAG: HD-GYP domain-containing protein [Motilibacteraceae bacterium]